MGNYRPKLEQRFGRQLVRIALLVALALFQTALAPSLWHFRIDWVLVVVVCWTILRALRAGIHWALPGGLALDMLSPLPVGSHLLSLLLAVTVAAVLTDRFPRDNRLIPTASVLLVSLVYGGTLGVVMSATGRPVAWERYPATILLPTALANGVAALPIYLILQRLGRGNQPNLGLEA